MTPTLDAHQDEPQQQQREHETEKDSEPSASSQSEQTQPLDVETQVTNPSYTQEPLTLQTQVPEPTQAHETAPLQQGAQQVPRRATVPIRHAPAAQMSRGMKRPYTPVPQHIADTAAVLVFDCGYAIPDAVRIVKMPRGGLTKRLQRLSAKRDGRAPVPKRPRKSSNSVESHLSMGSTTAATTTTTAASSGVPPHIEDAACVLLFDCGYSLEIVLEIMKVPWCGLAQRLEHLVAHPYERQSFRARPDVDNTVVAAAPAPAAALPQPPASHPQPVPLARAPQVVAAPPVSSVSLQGPESALIDLLVFPDTALPCQRYHWGIGCSRVNCAWVHDQGSSLLELLKLIRGATTSIDLCVSQITCPEVRHVPSLSLSCPEHTTDCAVSRCRSSMRSDPPRRAASTCAWSSTTNSRSTRRRRSSSLRRRCVRMRRLQCSLCASWC